MTSGLSSDKLRLMFLISIYQPIAVVTLRDAFVRSAEDGVSFASVLRALREENYASRSDPIYCTPLAQETLQRLPLKKNRDVMRIFYLKELMKRRTVKPTGDL